jgi:hypothetical protein
MKISTIEKIFEGLDLSPETKKAIKESFDSAVAEKVNAMREEELDLDEAEGDENLVPDTTEAIGQFLKNLRTDPELLKVIRPYDKDNEEVTITDIQTSFRRMLDKSKNVKQDDIALQFIFTIFDLIANNQTVANAIARALGKPGSEEEMVPVEGDEMVAEADVDVIDVEEEEDEEEVISEAMVSAVDSYLSYIAEEWMTENKLAVENGIKTELVESFMVGLKNLYKEHAIEVPDSVDVVEKLNEKIDIMEEKLNKSIEKNVQLRESLEEEKRKVLVEQARIEFVLATSDLPKSKIEKIQKLEENFKFETLDEYKEKLGLLIESVTDEASASKKEKTILKEEDLNTSGDSTITEAEEIDPRVAKYAKFIKGERE